MARRTAERRIRVWCAAAAGGQEPYSIAMELAERKRKFAGWSFEIVALDFVEEALAKARKGVYSQFEVQKARGADPARGAARAGRLSRAWRGGDHDRGLERVQAGAGGHHGLFCFPAEAAAAAEARRHKPGEVA